MEQQYALKVRAGIQILITTLTVILLLMVWPFHVFHHSAVSAYADTVLEETDAITMDEIVLQPFVPGGTHIADMEIAVRTDSVHEMDRVFVTLYDDAYNQVWQEVVYFNDIEALGILRIKPELDVVPGNLYYIGLNVHFDSVGTLHALYGSREELGVSEHRDFAYGGHIYEGMAVPVHYHYTAPFSLKLNLVCVLGILFVAAALYLAAVKLSEAVLWMAPARKQLLKNMAWLILCLAVLAGLGYCFYQLCIVRYFGGKALDIGVYAAACAILAAGTGCLFFRRLRIAGSGTGILLNKTKETVQESGGRREKHLPPVWKPVCPSMWRNYLQTLSFVFLLQYCVGYVNATIQWRQTLSAAWVLLLFGVACVCSFTKRELVRPHTLIWGVCMAVIGVFYCRQQAGTEHGVQIGAVYMVAAFLWGLVLLRIISGLRQKKQPGIYLPVGILWLFSCVGMMIFAHGKSWPFFMAVSFTLFFLMHDTEALVKRVAHNFANGVLVHFIFMLVLCLLFRPYRYYGFNRYPLWFHTVASTGMYLALAEAVALVRLFLKMRDTQTVFGGCIGEWILHSLIIAYTSFTVARTALMSICGLLIVMAVGAAVVYRPRLRRYLQVLGLLVMMLVLCVPVCYTAARCIPAIVNRPYFVAKELEDSRDALKEGDAPDSNKYMDFKALLRLWGARLHLPEFLTRPFADDVYVPENNVTLMEYEAPVYVASMTAGLPEGMAGGMPGGMQVLIADSFTGIRTLAADLPDYTDELTNGRLSIFKIYLAHLNLTGHERMGYEYEDGTVAAHAHNTFIQTAYDFGIPTGIFYLMLWLISVGYAVVTIWKGKDRGEAVYLALAVLIVFLVTGLSEYAGNPSMPLCFAALFALVAMRKWKNVVS